MQVKLSIITVIKKSIFQQIILKLKKIKISLIKNSFSYMFLNNSYLIKNYL